MLIEVDDIVIYHNHLFICVILTLPTRQPHTNTPNVLGCKLLWAGQLTFFCHRRLVRPLLLKTSHNCC